LKRKADIGEKMIDTIYLNELKETLKKIEEKDIDNLLEKIKKDEKGFPNRHWFSDHLPVGCTFTMESDMKKEHHL
jgi:hypothetical protein